MKIDKTTCKARKERQIGMTFYHTSRPTDQDLVKMAIIASYEQEKLSSIN